jgi:hypothetical protein
MGDAAALRDLREHMRRLLGDAPVDSVAPPSPGGDCYPALASDGGTGAPPGAWAATLPVPPALLQPEPHGAWSPPGLGLGHGLGARVGTGTWTGTGTGTGVEPGDGTATSTPLRADPSACGSWLRAHRVVLCIAAAVLAAIVGIVLLGRPPRTGPGDGHRSHRSTRDRVDGTEWRRARDLDEDGDREVEACDTREGPRSRRGGGRVGVERGPVYRKGAAAGGAPLDHDSEEGTEDELESDDEDPRVPTDGATRGAPREREESTRGNDPMFQSLVRR